MPDTAAIERLLAGALEPREGQSLPEATYRLQFHEGFTFRDAARIVPYLHELGMTHCYASPYLKARPGSMHGYDITDHSQLNPEIGTDEDYREWVDALHEHSMGHVLDTVPNHMGVLGNENPWWNDVLENGPSSPYASYFDIAWFASPRPELNGKILLPVLGEPYGKALEAGQIRLRFEGGAFGVSYFDHRFPVAPRSYGLVLGYRIAELEALLGADGPQLHEYQSILTAVKHLPRSTETEPHKVAERQREKEVIKRRLATLTAASGAVRGFLEDNVARFNGSPGDTHSFDLLDEMLADQPYRLSYWRVASDEINYRRFFDINELAALSMERPEVFEATHALTLRLLSEGKVDGLRIDHPDGLYDPEEYLWRLQRYYVLARARALYEEDPESRATPWEEIVGPLVRDIDAALRQIGQRSRRWPLYNVVEKILGANESLPEEWPTCGTSGYDFLNQVNGLFVDPAAAPAFTRLYQQWTRDDTPFAELVFQSKFLILQIALSSELHMLAFQLDRLAQKHRWSRDFTLNGLRHALRAVIATFPVYRSYTTAAGVSERDRRYVLTAIRRARARNPAQSGAIFDFIRDMLLLKYPETATDEDKAEQVRFVGKFQQVTAPVMAKGLEDTVFYVYNRLVSLNEVGGDPDRFGLAPAALHRYLQERQTKWPYALSPLSTHDTKRSEDVRARINLLSELPDEWAASLARWSAINRQYKVEIEDESPAPDPNEEYLIYQTLLGAWPLEPYSPEEFRTFVERMQAYVTKALHEAKVHTSWINPNPTYDEAVRTFVGRILDEQTNRAFLDDFRELQRRISHYGLFNALSQTLVRLTAPGVPDTYQGTELWDFSLVDPDNRRPVDYERRPHLLAELRERAESARDLPGLARELAARKEDGRIKLYVTWKTLTFRRENPGLLSKGEYLPAGIVGERQENVFAFVRRHEGRVAVVAVPRMLTGLISRTGSAPLGPEVWKDTRLILSGGSWQAPLQNIFTGAELKLAASEGNWSLPLGEVFRDLPVAVLSQV
jgi:(1->4)-alpha-D-glucan 1-alpha-D-glucosylmutase